MTDEELFEQIFNEIIAYNLQSKHILCHAIGDIQYRMKQLRKIEKAYKEICDTEVFIND